MLDEAFGWLDARQSNMTAELMELANLNSGSSHLDGLLAVAEWLKGWMQLPTTQFEQLALPARKLVLDSGDRIEVETGPALRWDCRSDCSRRVLLAIHYDTVFDADSAFQLCQQLDSRRIQGPGVADAKGGIVVLRYALAALERFALANDLGWTVVLNPDEEVGSPSSSDLFASLAGDFDFGLLFEPALPTRELVSQRKGSGNYDIVVRGKSAHAGRHFEDGRNAVAMISRLLSDLDGLNGARKGVTVNVGAVSGGGPVNIVPDRAVGRFNVRVPDPESVVWIENQLQQLIHNANMQPGFEVELFGEIASPPKIVDEKITRLMRAVEAAELEIGGQKIGWRQTGGVCDGNKLAAAGLPNIDTLGPIGDGLHSHQEWVDTHSLAHKAKVVVHILDKYARKEFEL